jgi:hypothetical protein
MQNTVNQDYMRIEIATLVKDLEIISSDKGKFNIPVLMTNKDTTTVVSSNSNIVNTSSKKKSKIDINDYIELSVPIAFKMFFTENKYIPKGTRFLVTFVGANVNDARIVGIYDSEPCNNLLYSYYELQEKVKDLTSKVERLESISSNNNK